MSREAVITGRGAVSPAGIGVRKLWDVVRNGKSAILREAILELEGLPVMPLSARFLDSDLETLRREHEAHHFEDAELLLWEVVMQALRESGATEAARRTTLLTAGLPSTGFEGSGSSTSYGVTLRSQNPSAPVPREGLGTRVFGEFAKYLNCELSVHSMHATCATGLRLVVEATRLIRLGRAERVIVAVVGRPVDALHFAGLGRSLALSRWDGEPRLGSRPFDMQRTGFVLGEAAAALVIEDESAQQARSAPGLGRVRGWGLGMNAENLMRTNFQQIVRVMKEALQTSRLDAEQISLVDSMGTGSILGDREEARAIHRVFGERVTTLPVSAHKSVLGYSAQASALLELVACTCALEHAVIPPVPSCEVQELDLELSIRTQAQNADIRTVMKNAIGMGGHYGSLIIERS